MITGTISTPIGEIMQVAPVLSRSDFWGTVKVRWSIGRDKYMVDPGLYAVGEPGDRSDVFVTANYKLSFDHLRKNLDGINAWILVLDTKGINVWCAAGKGTFGTDELVNRIRQSQLEKVISHRRIIVPQLGATGVSAHRVKALTSSAAITKAACGCSQRVDFTAPDVNLKVNRGFSVVFGPVRAADIKAFIANGYKTTPEMRNVNFTMADRIILAPVDVVYARYKLLAAFAVIFILAGVNREGINFVQAIDKGLPAMLYILLAYFAGILFTPLFLPYIPVRMFAFKGFITGIFLSVVLLILNKIGNGPLEVVAWFLLISAISSFMAMNFTGASTFTSLSGVKKEMRTFVPIQVSSAAIGLILFVMSNLLTI
jgi:hypothetical protein